MLRVRPIAERDYPALLQIAEDSGHGFTSLPIDETLLKSKIQRSVRSFAKEVKRPGDELYLMVLEERETGEVVGTCAIEAAVGIEDAFYHYRLGKDVHVSPQLGIRREVHTLTLCNDYTGAAELCTLYLKPEWRKGDNGRFLSMCRFLLLAAFPERFGDKVIAEMRGVSDHNGGSPFWQWLEDHFFGIDFPTADYLTGIGDKVFVAELMPRHPIYVDLLSPEAQAVVGEVHETTRPALRLLQSQGFRCQGYVDIFDAGPTVECQREEIKAVRESARLTLQVGEHDGDDRMMVTNADLNNLTIIKARAKVDEQAGVITLSRADADALGCDSGAELWALAMNR
ncbi:arginine N-succinyltransferase [Ferrimonas sediminicola]|uniref:Arginine N-succinyltransferase n=1 Tax=Ferrimonas sediminicola TaxID=2569538 RepID=A0A4U1BBQ8_9GAMM|nr:arginine N-succinyltransferase [Ferrimonas sediminicola]TKB48040.1 arginine N-succinyltransferase [Ferrimonas sediminicola]